MKILKHTNQALMFFIELIMLGSFAYFGFQKGHTVLFRYILAIALPTVGIVCWALWAAPKSSSRLPMPYLALFRVVLFLLASYFLYACRQTNLAFVVAAVSIITQVLGYYFKD